MATTRFADHLLTGTHASRPAATAVPAGTLYSCTDHALIYQSNGTIWSTYATLGATETLPATIVDAKGDLIAATAADTASRLAAGSNGTVLMADSTQTTGLRWATPGLIGTDNIFDAKGDLVAATAADTAVRLPVGSNGQVLTADTGETTGVKWATAGGGGIGAVLFDGLITGSDATSIDSGASGIAGGYKILEVWALTRTDDTGQNISIQFFFNNDTASNYDLYQVHAASTTVSGSLTMGWQAIFNSVGGGGDANRFGLTRITIPFYTETTAYKTAEAVVLATPNGTAGQNTLDVFTLIWKNTAAITRVSVAAVTAGKKLKVGSHLVAFGR